MAFSLEVKSSQLKGLPQEMSKLVPHHETKYMRDFLSIAISKNYHDTPVRRRFITSYLESLMLEFIEAASPYRTHELATTTTLSFKEISERRIRNESVL